MKLYVVSKMRLQMYGDDPIIVPATNQKAAIALVRLLLGSGTWVASGPIDDANLIDMYERHLKWQE